MCISRLYRVPTVIRTLNPASLLQCTALSIIPLPRNHESRKQRNRASMPEPVNHQVNAARKTFQTLHQISKLLNTNLDPATLSVCIRLCENGVNPQALATVVKELQREVKVLGSTQSESAPSKMSLTK